jgi:hypothetical protein
MLTSYLDSKFQNNRRVTLGSLVKKIRTGETIPSGALVVMASGDRRLRLKMLEQDTPNKGFSEPLVLNDFAAEHKVTANYLHWYLSQPEVANHLVEHATGAVFLRVPRTFLHAIPVPLPTSVTRIKPIMEFSVVKTNNPFSKIIGDLHNDYLLNVANRRYRTATVLAAAICEVVLYQLLIEHGVNQKLLKSDRGLGMNKLLDYIRILKLEQARGFPLSQLEEIRKNRNSAIHAGLLVSNEHELTASDLDAFNPVIKYFGL